MALKLTLNTNVIMIGQKVAIMLLLILLEEQSHSYAKIVSSPRQLYLLEGDRGTLRCQNRSMDEQTFYSSVPNAIWWRHNADGTTTSIGKSGSILSSGHTLNIPISNESQGNYSCCLPDRSVCSNHSVVIQSTPPIIKAVDSNYTAMVGSQVTLECNITALGVPTAVFGWNKNGYAISYDTVINNISLALTLRNITMEDAGVYTCIARNAVSYRNDRIELAVMEQMNEKFTNTTEHTNYFNESSTELITVRVLAEDIKTTCQFFEINAPLKLKIYIHEQYNHDVTVNTTEITCNDDESVAICDFQFVGSSAKSALQLFVNDLNNSNEGIDFNFCRVRLCNQNCSRSNLISKENSISEEDGAIDKNNNDNDTTHLLFIILLVMIIVFIIILALLCLAICHLRKKRRNIACLSMHKCVINESPALRNFNSSRGNNGIVDQFSSPTSSLSQYNTLQFDYNTDRNLSPNNNLPSVHFMPSSHQHQNAHSLTSNFEMHSDHTTALSSHSTNMLQANGYVLPDDFGKQSHNMPATRSNLTTETRLKSAKKRNKPAHKTAVILRSDGTGIIRTGTLQALIPSSRSDENYAVTPSQTHESYFDVVKNT